MKFPFLPCLAGVAVSFLATSAHASSIIVTPLLIGGGSATSTSTTIGGSRTIDSALNGVGLSGGGLSGNILTETHATAQGNTNNHYLSDTYTPASNVSNEIVTFDLGGSFDIDAIYFWAYNRAENNRGIRTFDIAFDTGSGFGAAVPVASLGISDFARGDTSASSSVQTRTFNSVQSGVEAIQFTNITNFGGDRIAISEIRFGAIPEPAAIVLGSLGLLRILRRRRS